MTSERPMCRLEAMERGMSYPRSACLRCNWSVTKGSIEEMCQVNKPFVLVINGPRDLTVWLKHIGYTLDRLGWKPTKIIEGGANGVDTSAHNYALNNGIEVHTEPALWDVYERGAGPRRNMKMAGTVPDGWLSFIRPGVPITSGTASGIAEAVRFKVPNIEVVEYDRENMQKLLEQSSGQTRLLW